MWLGTSVFKEEEAVAVGVITVRTESRGRKARLITDVTSTAFGKQKNDGTPVGYSGRLALRRENGDI